MWHEKNRRVYLIGNPLLWYSSSLAVIVAMLVIINFLLRQRFKANFAPPDPEMTGLIFLVLAYLGSFVPFMLIGQTMFLYHYLTPLCLAIMILAMLITRFIPLAGKSKPAWLATIIILTIASFIFVAPVTYGGELGGKWWEYLLKLIRM